MNNFQTTLAEAEKLYTDVSRRFGDARGGALKLARVAKLMNAGYSATLAVYRIADDNNDNRSLAYCRRALALMDQDPAFMKRERNQQFNQEIVSMCRVAEHFQIEYTSGKNESVHICSPRMLELQYVIDWSQWDEQPETEFDGCHYERTCS